MHIPQFGRGQIEQKCYALGASETQKLSDPLKPDLDHGHAIMRTPVKQNLAEIFRASSCCKRPSKARKKKGAKGPLQGSPQSS